MRSVPIIIQLQYRTDSPVNDSYWLVFKSFCTKFLYIGRGRGYFPENIRIVPTVSVWGGGGFLKVKFLGLYKTVL